MKYNSFHIEKYKAIAGINISLKPKLLPIIGINESGKTTVLQAILAFDENNDQINEGKHLDAKNRYEIDSNDPIIKAYISFEDENELKYILNEVGYKKTTKLYQELENYIKQNKPIILCRNLESKSYYLEGITATHPNNLGETLIRFLPYILYFDDFNDRVPEQIIFTNNYLSTDLTIKYKNWDEWNEYLEEIFRRATGKEIITFFTRTDKNEQDAIISDINEKLNEEIINEWEKLKILKNELKNEITNNLKIELIYQFDVNQNLHVFKFRVIDTNNKRNRFFNINERSKGFQWFFNFAIKLKYNPKYVDNVHGAIYLLDEPGSYLHSSAQEELLKSLSEISKTNTVIYCTHSQYLLNPDYINVSNIKIAEKQNGNILLKNFGEYNNISKSFSALNPLYDALKLNILEDTNIRSSKILITEGLIDFYLIKLLKIHIKTFSNFEFDIIPGTGADSLKELISFCYAWAKEFKVLLDSDEQGIKSYKKYTTLFPQNVNNNIILLKTKEKHNNVELEDLFTKKDQFNLKKITKANDFKKSLITLFHSTNSIQAEYFHTIDNATLNNFNYLFELLNNKAKKIDNE